MSDQFNVIYLFIYSFRTVLKKACAFSYFDVHFLNKNEINYNK